MFDSVLLGHHVSEHMSVQINYKHALLPKYSSVSIVTRQWAGQRGFDSWQGQEFFLFTTMPRLTLGPIQPTIQWIMGVSFLGDKATGL